jgi:bacterioferritin
VARSGKTPEMIPAALFHGGGHKREGSDRVDMIREDLVAERVAIDSDGEIIRYLGEDDPTTRRMFEEILAVEEEHAEDLQALVQKV